MNNQIMLNNTILKRVMQVEIMCEFIIYKKINNSINTNVLIFDVNIWKNYNIINPQNEANRRKKPWKEHIHECILNVLKLPTFLW